MKSSCLSEGVINAWLNYMTVPHWQAGLNTLKAMMTLISIIIGKQAFMLEQEARRTLCHFKCHFMINETPSICHKFWKFTSLASSKLWERRGTQLRELLVKENLFVFVISGTIREFPGANLLQRVRLILYLTCEKVSFYFRTRLLSEKSVNN